MPRADRLTVLCVAVDAEREFAAAQIVLARRATLLFSSDRFLSTAGGPAAAAALVADAIRCFVGESPLPLARLLAMRLQSGLTGLPESIRVVAMSDAAARSLTGLSGPLLHADSVSVGVNELLVALLNGDGCEPCSFHSKYRRSLDGWQRAEALSYVPLWT